MQLLFSPLGALCQACGEGTAAAGGLVRRVRIHVRPDVVAASAEEESEAAPEGSMNPRRIILAGGSGFLGQRLAVHLHACGWEPIVLTRSPNASARFKEIPWDAKTIGPWAEALNGAEAVINLTGRSVNCRYTPANRRAILDSRVDSTRVVGEAIALCSKPPRAWLNASTATLYEHTFGPPNV